MKGYVHSAEARRKISLAMTGKKRGPHSPERRAKISASNMGRTLSPEHRAKISEAQARLWAQPEYRAKLSRIRTGRCMPAEVRAKSSRTHLHPRIIGECVYCFGPATEYDHVIPQSRGGCVAAPAKRRDHRQCDRVLCCGSCNKSKGRRTIDEWAAAATEVER